LVPVFFWPFFFDVPAMFYLIVWFFGQIIGAQMAPQDPTSVVLPLQRILAALSQGFC